MENTSKNRFQRTPMTPVKKVTPIYNRNQYLREKVGSTIPQRKIHDCLGAQSFSRGDNCHTGRNCGNLQKRFVGEEAIQNLESMSSMSTITNAMNLHQNRNILINFDPIDVIKFISRTMRKKIKCEYPELETLSEMATEIYCLAKRIEYGDTVPMTGFMQFPSPVLDEYPIKTKKLVEKCSECEGLNSIIKQLEIDLSSEKEQNKILTNRIIDLEAQIKTNQSNENKLHEELQENREKIKILEKELSDKKSLDTSIMSRFDEYSKNIKEMTHELCMKNIENEKQLEQLQNQENVLKDLYKDLDELEKLNKNLCYDN